MLQRRTARWETVSTVATLLWVGISFGFAKNTSGSFRFLSGLVSLRMMGALLLGAVAGVILGTIWSWNVRRWSLSLAAGVVTTVALGFLVAVLADLVEVGSTPSAAAPAVYGFLAIQLVLQAGEPKR